VPHVAECHEDQPGGDGATANPYYPERKLASAVLAGVPAAAGPTDLMRMSRELEALLGRAVDVVSAGGLKNRDQAILAESVDL
jgi:hypothetical protein